MNINREKIRTAFLISGGGTTVEAIIKACQSGKLQRIDPVVVISSRSDTAGTEKAKKLGITALVVKRKKFPSQASFGKQLLKIFKNFDIDLVSQNGWMPLTPKNVVRAYQGRIINQHPGPLDPKTHLDFGGKGMYGSRVMCSVLIFRWLTGKNFWTEATTHFVNNQYDQGDLIRTLKMKLPKLGRPITLSELEGNPQKLITTTKETQKLLLLLEHKNVIKTLGLFAAKKKVVGHKRLHRLIPNRERPILNQAKLLAIKLFPEG